MTTWIVLAVIVAIAVYVISLYNRLVRQRQMVREGWSGIDVQLKRRFDLIPNLVETVKGYMTHERDTLAAVTEMRAQAGNVPSGDVTARAQAEGMLGAALGRLLAVAESYPDLKASNNFLELQNTLEKVEHELQMARRYYNGAVRDLNVMVESFPSNLVAGQFGFSKEDYFEIEDASERATPQVSFGSR
ncbi:LemA protein [Breoghania corrubedonensis]|uniref:LemA protein n=1 Tax=Breoghania corrubedonensis TaxID=665038 RepID=A0A2T5VEM8_9HYPH|nr:LemA family protein [Breoghania corrubedonensis]PTW62212.1 LemA protein [Breoghania corrubedonensis]